MRIPVFLIQMFLASCAGLPAGTALYLSRQSPLETDPADFAVRLALPPQVRILPDSVVLSVDVVRPDTGESHSARYVLQTRNAAEGEIYALSDPDARALRDMQTIIRTWKLETDGAAGGSLSLALSPCGLASESTNLGRVSAWLLLRASGQEMPLLKDVPVSDLVDTGLAVPPCPKL